MTQDLLEITSTDGIKTSCKYLTYKLPEPKLDFNINIKKVTVTIPKTENIILDAAPHKFMELMGDEESFRNILKYLKNFNSSSPKLILIHGKSGIGKSTMIELIAKQAKYKTITDVTASTNLSNLNHSFGKLCVVLDEIDVHPERRTLIGSLIRQRNKIQVPVICICSDLYESSIRILKNYVFLYELQSPTKEQIANRFLYLCEHSKIATDKITMIKLVELCHFDLRLCINAIQLFSTQSGTSLHFHMSTLNTDTFRSFTNKDMSCSLPLVLTQLFYTAQGHCNFNSFEPLAKQEDYDLIISGILKNYILVPIMDRKLIKFKEIQDWFSLNACSNFNSNTTFKQAFFYFIHMLYGCPRKFRFELKAIDKPKSAKTILSQLKFPWHLKKLACASYSFDNKQITKAAQLLKYYKIESLENKTLNLYLLTYLVISNYSTMIPHLLKYPQHYLLY